MSDYVSFTLYLIPFFLAGAVLIRARIRKMRSKSDFESEPIVNQDEHLVEEAGGRPISRPYISYTT